MGSHQAEIEIACNIVGALDPVVDKVANGKECPLGSRPRGTHEKASGLLFFEPRAACACARSASGA